MARARGPLIAYWLLSMGGLGALVLTIMSTEGGAPRDFHIFVLFAVGCMVGLAAGNLLALLRLRFWLNLAFGFVNVVLIISLAAAGAPSAEVLVLSWIGFLMGLSGGHLALSHRFGLAAAWLPILCWVGAIMVYLNNHGRVTEWEESKISAWMPVPLVFLACLAVLIVAYMAAKESHRLGLWELLGGAPWKRTLIHADKPRIRLTARGWLAILALATIVFAAAAIVSPYLWRTGRGDRDGHHTGQERSSTKPDPRHRPPDWDWDGVARALRKVSRHAERGARTILPFLPLFILNRPIRRAVRLRHWQRPLHRVPPTERVKNLWRLIATGATDAGIAPRPSDSIEDLVDRTAQAARDSGRPRSDAMRRAGEIYSRVRYGLGIRPGEIDELRTAAVQAYRDVRANMSTWQRLRCWWRKDA